MASKSAGILMYRIRNHIPEVDRAEWFAMDLAKAKILKGQVCFLEELEKMLRSRKSPGDHTP